MIFRQLQQAFPHVLFFPENTFNAFWSTAAPYKQVNLNFLGTPQSVKDMYPCAFSMIQAIDGTNYSDPRVVDALVQAVQGGDILFVDWYADPQTLGRSSGLPTDVQQCHLLLELYGGVPLLLIDLVDFNQCGCWEQSLYHPAFDNVVLSPRCVAFLGHKKQEKVGHAVHPTYVFTP